MAITYYHSQRYDIFHFHIHQTIKYWITKLNLPQKLNELVDIVIHTFVRTPLNTNISFAPIAMYFNNNYITNNVQHHDRRLVFQNIANEFLKRKNIWRERTSEILKWDSIINELIKKVNMVIK